MQQQQQQQQRKHMEQHQGRTLVWRTACAPAMEEAPLLRLPYELLFIIVRLTEPSVADACRLGLVCRKLLEVSRDHGLWRKWFAERFCLWMPMLELPCMVDWHRMTLKVARRHVVYVCYRPSFLCKSAGDRPPNGYARAMLHVIGSAHASPEAQRSTAAESAGATADLERCTYALPSGTSMPVHWALRLRPRHTLRDVFYLVAGIVMQAPHNLALMILDTAGTLHGLESPSVVALARAAQHTCARRPGRDVARHPHHNGFRFSQADEVTVSALQCVLHMIGLVVLLRRDTRDEPSLQAFCAAADVSVDAGTSAAAVATPRLPHPMQASQSPAYIGSSDGGSSGCHTGRPFPIQEQNGTGTLFRLYRRRRVVALDYACTEQVVLDPPRAIVRQAYLQKTQQRHVHL
jgi:hypothetical protein